MYFVVRGTDVSHVAEALATIAAANAAVGAYAKDRRLQLTST
jgi:hypothetical protein